jgi:uncharacterized repeat protein (TIGR02543 family)
VASCGILSGLPVLILLTVIFGLIGFMIMRNDHFWFSRVVKEIKRKKSMKTLKLILGMCTAIYYLLSTGAQVQAAVVIDAASCSQTDVQAAIDAAQDGNTVLVPSGTTTWSSCLLINKGIILKGAGIDQTVIISSITDTQFGGIIKYAPAINAPFRVSGFTLDGNDTSNGIFLTNPTTTIMDQVRIDHNRIINPGGTFGRRCIHIDGAIYGVIDNNIFETSASAKIAISNYGDANGQSGYNEWTMLPRDFGTAQIMYYEDNILVGNDSFLDGGHGGRYAVRYNTFVYNGSLTIWPVMDAHGNQANGGYAMMLNEIYGNKIDLKTKGGLLYDGRGGQALVFFNQVTAGAPVVSQVREEYDDAIYPMDSHSPHPLVMHASNSYYWNNRSNGSLINVSIGQDTFDGSTPNNPPVLAENREFWQQKALFDGTTGMGCGPLANRPTTCTPGVAYWATDQDCTQVSDDNVGAHPKEPIRGTLYKCTAPNVWTAHYTPYTYPHPLRVAGPLSDTLLIVTSPNGGGNWQKGSTQSIRWTANEVSGEVEIELCKSGTSVLTIAKVPASNETYLWTVDSSLTNDENYQVRIYQGSIEDYSDDTFSINSSPSIYVVKFAAGAGGTLSGNTNQTVTDGESTSEVRAVPNSGYAFAGWSGDVSGTTNPLVVSDVQYDMSIAAHFSANNNPQLQPNSGSGGGGGGGGCFIATNWNEAFQSSEEMYRQITLTLILIYLGWAILFIYIKEE